MSAERFLPAPHYSFRKGFKYVGVDVKNTSESICTLEVMNKIHPKIRPCVCMIQKELENPYFNLLFLGSSPRLSEKME